MTRSERRLLVDTSTLGVLLTLLALALGWMGGLAPAERFFYDWRARYCRFFTPAPTDQLVHLDIDDLTLEAMGAWPWPRGRLAELVDEIAIAGAKALAMDVIFSEPQAIAYEPVRRGSSFVPTTKPITHDAVVTATVVDHDAALAKALARFGRAIVPLSLSFNLQQSTSSVYRPMVIELFRNPEMDRDALIQRLRGKATNEVELGSEVNRLFLAARQEAMYERIASEAGADELTIEQLTAKLLPQMDARIQEDSPLRRLLETQFERYRAIKALRRFARPVGPDLPPMLSTADERATLRVFGEAAGSTAFVDYVPMADGIVRTVPLWAVHREWMYPQMGLALACASLDVNPKDVKIRPDAVILTTRDGDIEIPVRIEQTPQGRRGMFFDIPWFGAASWETMYDYPKHEGKKQHISLAFVWDACQVRHRIAKNNRAIDAAIAAILDNDQEYQLGLDPARAKRYFASLPDEGDTEARREIARWTLKESGVVKFLDRYAKYKDEELDANDLFLRDVLRQSCKSLDDGFTENDKLKKDLEHRRAELRAKLGGKAALMGWVAVGSLADVVPTSLHTRCPGVVVHGVIFNSILTRDFWHRTPQWVTSLIALAMGLLATGIVAWMNPWRALAATIVLMLGYLLFNGLYLFDKHNLLVGVADPMVTAGTVWAGGTLAKYILEASLRAKIKHRFEIYADPELVNYVMETDARLDGQVKEMTVVFTDLAEFTSKTERLGERIVPLLNRYMGAMVPVIHKRRHGPPGLLNKFLGDGIMFFHGAPFDNPNHAHDAVAAVLEMLAAMGPLNNSLAAESLPRLELRAGIASGNMVVGDAGSEHRSDYTVLGDTVNLGARLEPANKVFGTKVLMNERTSELVNDSVLWRPIGKIQVLGKAEGVQVAEPLSLIENATQEQKQLVELTTVVVKRFMDGDFAACIEAIDVMEAATGKGKLTVLYRALCDRYLREGSEAFTGQIVLTAK